MDRRFPLIPAALVLVATGLYITYIYRSAETVPRDAMVREEASSETTWVLQEPRKLGFLGLRNQHDQDFSVEQLRGRWSLLFFGYTHCPDICTPTLGRMSEARRLLRHPHELSLVFVSVDPERDDGRRLRQFLELFQDTELLGLHGDKDQIKALALQLGAEFRREEEGSPEAGYLVQHSSRLFLVNPEARLSAVLDGGRQGQELAAELNRLLLPPSSG